MVPKVVRDIDMVVHAALDFAPVSEEIRHRVVEAYPQIKDELIDYCKKKKLLPFVAKLMITLSVDVDAWENLLKTYRIRNSKTKLELEKLFCAIQGRGIANCYPIENFAALLASEEDIGLFASGDIDVYAGQANHKTVHEVMPELGYTRYVANEYQCYCYRKDSSPIGINMMWMWQSRRNMPFQTNLDIPNIGTGGHAELQQLPVDELMYMCLLHASVHHYVCELALSYISILVCWHERM